MKTLIAYDSRYGTTTTVAHWLCEALGGDCDIANVADVSSFDYDLIVIGSPIYTDEPLASVTQFLHEHRNTLSEKKVALFFVYDQLLTLKSEKYVEQLRAYAPPGVLAVGVFGGYFDINALNEHIVARWRTSLSDSENDMRFLTIGTGPKSCGLASCSKQRLARRRDRLRGIPTNAAMTHRRAFAQFN
jgi:menaquinone-dependent protoporphyrinogen IX oxidase